MSAVPDYEWTKEDAALLKALFAGGADAAAQRRVIVHLVEILCGQNQIGFDPDNAQITAFNAGRRWVARQLQNAITIPLDRLIKDTTDESDGSSGRVVSATERRARAEAECNRIG